MDNMDSFDSQALVEDIVYFEGSSGRVAQVDHKEVDSFAQAFEEEIVYLGSFDLVAEVVQIVAYSYWDHKIVVFLEQDNQMDLGSYFAEERSYAKAAFGRDVEDQDYQERLG